MSIGISTRSPEAQLSKTDLVGGLYKKDHFGLSVLGVAGSAGDILNTQAATNFVSDPGASLRLRRAWYADEEGGQGANKPFWRQIIDNLTGKGRFRNANPNDLIPDPGDPYSRGGRNGDVVRAARDYIQAHGNIEGRIMVFEDEPGNYYIDDGHHRWEAARTMGLKSVPIQVLGPLPDDWGQIGRGGK